MGWHLDGRVTAVAGTHTHVQTADERLLPKGTAYITDAGMTGPHDSIIGVTVDAALGRFVTGMPARSSRPPAGGARLNAVDRHRRSRDRARRRIERLNLSAAEVEALAESHGDASRAGPDRPCPISFSQPFEEDERGRRPAAPASRSGASRRSAS